MVLSDLRRIIMLFFWYVLKWYFWLTHVWKNNINTLIKSFSQKFKNQLVMLFNLNVLFKFNLFMTSTTFFFIMIVEQCTDNKYVAPKMSLRSAENDAGKNSFVKNHVLFSNNVVGFLSTPFCVFLISVGIFNNSLKTWFLILIYLIKRHKFFFRDICINRFAEFQNFCFVYDFLFVIICMKIRLSIFSFCESMNIWRNFFAFLITSLHSSF